MIREQASDTKSKCFYSDLGFFFFGIKYCHLRGEAGLHREWCVFFHLSGLVCRLVVYNGGRERAEISQY